LPDAYEPTGPAPQASSHVPDIVADRHERCRTIGGHLPCVSGEGHSQMMTRAPSMYLRGRPRPLSFANDPERAPNSSIRAPTWSSRHEKQIGLMTSREGNVGDHPSGIACTTGAFRSCKNSRACCERPWSATLTASRSFWYLAGLHVLCSSNRKQRRVRFWSCLSSFSAAYGDFWFRTRRQASTPFNRLGESSASAGWDAC
jgi:hypothetical protein